MTDPSFELTIQPCLDGSQITLDLVCGTYELDPTLETLELGPELEEKP